MLLSSILRVNIAVLICGLALLPFEAKAAAQTSATSSTATGMTAQDDPDRPILKHGSQAQQVGKNEAPLPIPHAGPTVASGLALPGTGRVWALDSYDGKPALVHLLFYRTNVDRHSASNFAKVNIAPFIAKTKATVELKGAKAAIRLHELTPTFFIKRTPIDNEDAAIDPSTADTYTSLTLVKLEVHGDKRLVDTMAFTQITGKASRSINSVGVNTDNLPDSNWMKITPKHPLAPGEYGLVALPRGQSLIPTHVFEFAIDPAAPQNKGMVLPEDR